MTKGFFVTGIGTEIGKTVIAALLTEALGADYWKPVQAGTEDPTDSETIHRLCDPALIHPESYRLKAPMSPHAAAYREAVTINMDTIQLPATDNLLIAEGAGGLMVPLNEEDSILDLIEELQLPVVLVSRHYLGSINHTLMSIEMLEARAIPVAALIYNGAANPDTEGIIEKMGGLSPLLRLDELPELNKERIKEMAEKHRPALLHMVEKFYPDYKSTRV